ncbi:onanonoxo-7-onima-8-eninoihtemlysoneda [Talaromyces stipitatus ATCC 10500]|uniref:Onanonoxo-7-onima-8-eninoihtemlysoneda n=1 Tax=Talaromyces stipitatus (strain ATCC 10500 / CBS 375.48 / QM 6759 / NRRL 1006) TaxID=441959 RepID=B8M622_TALSN|nr:onanonoxo-7-onima-8-eninoihtemlysoneda [Talaromyces stipitatus ATCC 10500]EED19022.1 onanonoxo-7-onima-8-eninoihtemlysoneda [Talaromyces stipitatus ATCC 10500]
MTPIGAALWRNLRVHQIYGANTDVGKTIASTLLVKALSEKSKVGFLKPVSTGSLNDADDRHVRQFTVGNNNVLTKCLYQFGEPVSPHIAAQSTQVNNEILSSIYNILLSWSRAGLKNALVETAGGVHSPGPNGTSQADLYRPLRLPIVLVADSRLGGISSSISAFESLLLRGYDVHSVLLFQDDYYQNHEYLDMYFSRRDIPLLAFPKPPSRPEGNVTPDTETQDQVAMKAYYESLARGLDLDSFLQKMEQKCERRIENLENMAARANEAIWYPFTQHQGVRPRDITVIESAYGDYFQTYKASADIDQDKDDNVLQSTFDGSASWWTQGLGHGNPELALTAAHAAGKYGHVMFAGTVHRPALDLAELLLESFGNRRLRKVFYTDNGSTGMEVAIKMALRASCARYDWDSSTEDIKILGLKGSYHGDTIGVMDCSEPSTYNKKVEWYRGRGFWFDFPTIGMKNARWHVTVPEVLEQELGVGEDFDSLHEIFDIDKRLRSPSGQRYTRFITKTLDRLINEKGLKFGALIMEPIILGAGGMLFADPLFQRCLVDVVRSHSNSFGTSSGSEETPTNWSGVPVVFDEVFTGLYRLGRRTSASFLGVDADISVHAKLLTGGLIPLAVTLASKEIFDAFLSCEKSDALLHGHSYTAHPIGCHVAETSVRMMMDMENQGDWDHFQKQWTATTKPNEKTSQGVWSHWSLELVRDLSLAENVESVFAIGSVFSISLLDESGQTGYTSTAARGLQQKLALGASGTSSFNVHSRVLGNVLYLMASMKSTPGDLRGIEILLRNALLH